MRCCDGEPGRTEAVVVRPVLAFRSYYRTDPPSEGTTQKKNEATIIRIEQIIQPLRASPAPQVAANRENEATIIGVEQIHRGLTKSQACVPWARDGRSIQA